MLCADCKKNVAVIFVNKEDKDGKIKRIGYCYSCAKKRGITNIDNGKSGNLDSDDLTNVTGQLNDILKDLSGSFAMMQGMNQEDFENLEEASMMKMVLLVNQWDLLFR